ncbi:hypothetical protein EZ313_04575 [Ramlibacter henchirensis]|uniref:YMGG-like Gly-zipper domain-containing protein n=1 Tax=Ramlibacter henchirensis TaxID=204072 RepID=A0A4Z0C4R6_9BURK|nr:hypothetical protein [Ramlibacter henchirensis]TFZ05932.1 hypothetical protein EZ313_04575 [Ramlibacter henchirensis]
MESLLSRKSPFTGFALVSGMACLAAAAIAAEPSPVVYPARGQSSQQLDKDRYECHDWSRSQSGFDPTQASAAAPAAAQPASPANPTGGMVRGALAGASVAELADRDASKGAAAGVAGAAAVGRIRTARQQQGAQQAAQQQNASRSQQKATYDRAFGACMEGRGYVVR